MWGRPGGDRRPDARGRARRTRRSGTRTRTAACATTGRRPGRRSRWAAPPRRTKSTGTRGGQGSRWSPAAQAVRDAADTPGHAIRSTLEAGATDRRPGLLGPAPDGPRPGVRCTRRHRPRAVPGVRRAADGPERVRRVAQTSTRPIVDHHEGPASLLPLERAFLLLSTPGYHPPLRATDRKGGDRSLGRRSANGSGRGEGRGAVAGGHAAGRRVACRMHARRL